MQKKYPEHIADIEKYYQDSLDGISIEPPAAMWDRIESALDKNKKPKGFFFFFNRNILLASVLIILICIGSFFLFENINQNKSNGVKKDEPSTTSIPQEPVETSDNNSTSTEPSEKKNQARSVNNEKQNNIKAAPEEKTTNTSKDSILLKPNENSPVKPDNTNESEQNTKTEEVKTSKEKVSFKDKYKKKYQDSTRQIFVPEGK